MWSFAQIKLFFCTKSAKLVGNMENMQELNQQQNTPLLIAEEDALPFVKRRRSFSFLINIAFYLCGFILIVITGFSYLYILTDVEGRSMQPTINPTGLNTDMAYINRVKKGERGDIIVFKNEINRKYVIKRLIAMGGDKIFIGKRNGDVVAKVYLKLSGSEAITLLSEPYIANNDGMDTKTMVAFQALHHRADLEFDTDGFLVIPADFVFCLGDNRKVSDDSSYYGPVPTYDIVGRVDIIVHEGENPSIQAALFLLQQLGIIV